MISYFEQYDALAYGCLCAIKKLLADKKTDFINSREYDVYFPYVIVYSEETQAYDEKQITCIAIQDNELFLYCKTGIPSYYKGPHVTEKIANDINGVNTGWYESDSIIGRDYRFDLYDSLKEILKDK